MSSNTSVSPPPIETLPASSSKGKKPASKKPVSKKTATKAAPKAAPKAASHPSWKDIIKECIGANKEDARSGVSRATIKKFAEETYHIEVSGGNLYQLNRAITSGVAAGVFALPKGPSGKVKLAPKKKPASDDENSKPVPVKKPAVKKVPTKKPEAPVKKAATKETVKAKKPAATKKSTTATAKKAAIVPAPKKTAPKKTTAGAPAKKPTAKSAAPAKKASTAKTAEKKVAAKAAATKAAKKPASKAKPTSSRSRKVAA